MVYCGGYHCGAIRYRAEGMRDRASVCYCRVCQKASGSPFMAFGRFPAEKVSWPTPPALFASSNVVERGFCRDWGIPLSYRGVGGPNISLTIQSLDEPETARPEISFSAATQPSWCRSLADLPDHDFDLTDTAGFFSRQR